jgi:hypothetical protein
MPERQSRLIVPQLAVVALAVHQPNGHRPRPGQVCQHLIAISRRLPDPLLYLSEHPGIRDIRPFKSAPRAAKRLQDHELDHANAAALTHRFTPERSVGGTGPCWPSDQNAGRPEAKLARAAQPATKLHRQGAGDLLAATYRRPGRPARGAAPAGATFSCRGRRPSITALSVRREARRPGSGRRTLCHGRTTYPRGFPIRGRRGARLGRRRRGSLARCQAGAWHPAPAPWARPR